MDDIQHKLHESGKQQIINTYNTFTRYLKFKKRDQVDIVRESSLQVTRKDIINFNTTSTATNMGMTEINDIEMSKLTGICDQNNSQIHGSTMNGTVDGDSDSEKP